MARIDIVRMRFKSEREAKDLVDYILSNNGISLYDYYMYIGYPVEDNSVNRKTLAYIGAEFEGVVKDCWGYRISLKR